MSQRLISRSSDLKRLRDEGYEVEVRSGHLLVTHVPYVNSAREIKYGALVSELSLAGDVTTAPGTHVAHFVGEYPSHQNGTPIERIRNQSARTRLAQDLEIDHTFSSKPTPTGRYADYYEKVTTYVAIITSPAQAIDPNVTAKTFRLIEADEDDSVFRYIDTASSRAGIGAVNAKLEGGRVAIVGLGGTGSYVLDFVAKTPVREIHLFDGDAFLQHNAFRSPGAPSVEELREQPFKAAYWSDRYSRMRRGIVAHDGYIDASNVGDLAAMEFVFLCLDKGPVKRLIIQALEAAGVGFVDVGMGVYLSGDALGGIVRVTTSTPDQREHVHEKRRISYGEGEDHNEYARNIQIAELNALNAALAVIKWKKLCGFYLDLEHEHHSTYTIDGNIIINEDQK
jgi:hypothetical protein